MTSIFQIERTRRNLELAKVIQEDLDAHFFKHSMYGVKDALSSILALCDVNQMKDLPLVKDQIKKVNKLIDDVSLYSDNNAFNVAHVLGNILKMLQKNYQDSLSINCTGLSLEMTVKGNQTHLEQVLLYLMIEVMDAVKSRVVLQPAQIQMQLTRRDKDAVVGMELLGFRFDEAVRRELLTFANRYSLTAQINETEDRTRVYIHVPLSSSVPATNRSSSLKVSASATAKKEVADSSFVD